MEGDRRLSLPQREVIVARRRAWAFALPTGFAHRHTLSLLTGYDNNLLGSTRTTQLELTLPDGSLPVVCTGAYEASVAFWAQTADRYEQRRHDVERPLLPPSALYLSPELLRERLNVPLLVDAGQPIRRIAWCTGGAQGYFEQAIACGVDCFVSGEASEPTTHLARESGVAYLCVGHHASERYGVQALGAHLAEAFGIEVEFVEVPNPV